MVSSWSKIPRENGRAGVEGDKHVKLDEIISKQNIQGVPERLRGTLWLILLDIDRIKQEQEGKYQEMK